jgi:hypothetical protein
MLAAVRPKSRTTDPGEAKKDGQHLGFDQEQVALYDALAENGSAKDVMKSDQFRRMARELAEMVWRAQSRLDRAGVGPGRPAAAPCDVRVSAGSIRGCDATRA